VTLPTWLDLPGVITPSDIAHSFIETHKPRRRAAILAPQMLREQVDTRLLDPAVTGGRRLRAIDVQETYEEGRMIARKVSYTFEAQE
jgi:hypothetical protein